MSPKTTQQLSDYIADKINIRPVHFENPIEYSIQRRCAESTSIEAIYDAITTILPRCGGYELMRIGGHGDGAYLVPDDLDEIEACYSPGVNNRKTFEDELLLSKGILSYLCDFTSDSQKLITPLITPGQIFEKLWLDLPGVENSITLEEWIRRHSPTSQELILQMDIEGAEYRNIINTSQLNLSRFRIIILELHYLWCLSTKMFLLGAFLPCMKKITADFQCIHAHPNNCCGSWSPDGQLIVPNVLELVFLRKDRIKGQQGQVSLPHPLDIVNVPAKEPLFLGPPWSMEPLNNESKIRILEQKLDWMMLKICFFVVCFPGKSLCNRAASQQVVGTSNNQYKWEILRT